MGNTTAYPSIILNFEDHATHVIVGIGVHSFPECSAADNPWARDPTAEWRSQMQDIATDGYAAKRSPAGNTFTS